MKTKIDIYPDNPPDTLEYKVAVMTAAMDPKAIVEFKSVNSTIWGWQTNDPAWNWLGTTYRISPKCRPRKTVPLEASDIPAVCWVRWPSHPHTHALVVGIFDKSIRIGNNTLDYDYPYLAMQEVEYSTDRVNWKPMSKEIPA